VHNGQERKFVFGVQNSIILLFLSFVLSYLHITQLSPMLSYRAAKESGFSGSPVKERVSGIAAL